MEGICEGNNATDTSSKTKERKYWKPIERDLTSQERKTLVAEVLAVLCKVIMNHQVYNFGGKTYLQQGFGCIGDEAIGVIAWIVMLWWSKKLRIKLNELSIANEVMKIYVDDLNGLFEKLKPGTIFKNGRLEYDEEKAKVDETLPIDKVTMCIIKEIANTIDSMIKMT